MVAHGRLSDSRVRKFRQDPPIDASCRMPLLARRTPVLVQHGIDERCDRTQLRFSPRRVTMRRRHRAGDGLAYHPTMHTELRRHAGDRADAKFMLLTQLLEQFHSGVPIHSESPGKTRATVG